jgi:hypothetical protein
MAHQDIRTTIRPRGSTRARAVGPSAAAQAFEDASSYWSKFASINVRYFEDASGRTQRIVELVLDARRIASPSRNRRDWLHTFDCGPGHPNELLPNTVLVDLALEDCENPIDRLVEPGLVKHYVLTDIRSFNDRLVHWGMADFVNSTTTHLRDARPGRMVDLAFPPGSGTAGERHPLPTPGTQAVMTSMADVWDAGETIICVTSHHTKPLPMAPRVNVERRHFKVIPRIPISSFIYSTSKPWVDVEAGQEVPPDSREVATPMSSTDVRRQLTHLPEEDSLGSTIHEWIARESRRRRVLEPIVVVDDPNEFTFSGRMGRFVRYDGPSIDELQQQENEGFELLALQDVDEVTEIALASRQRVFVENSGALTASSGSAEMIDRYYPHLMAARRLSNVTRGLDAHEPNSDCESMARKTYHASRRAAEAFQRMFGVVTVHPDYIVDSSRELQTSLINGGLALAEGREPTTPVMMLTQLRWN